MVCVKSKFSCRLSIYQANSVHPDENDYRMRMGTPPIISKDKVMDLNKELKEYKGFVEKNLDLSKSLVKLSEGEKMVHRDYRHTKNHVLLQCNFTRY